MQDMSAVDKIIGVLYAYMPMTFLLACELQTRT